MEGRRAYALARQGQSPRLSPRTVFIHDLVILRYDPPELELEVCCSKGTYVRSLARDLGRTAGSCAYVKRLRRLAVGPFEVAQAASPEDFRPERHLLAPEQFLPRLPGMRLLTLHEERVAGIRTGAPMQDRYARQPPEADGLFALRDPGGELIAVAERRGGRYAYRCVL